MSLIRFAMTLRIHSPTCMGCTRGFSRAAGSSPVVVVGVARAADCCWAASPRCTSVSTAVAAAARAVAPANVAW
eukprot:11160115-Lingulodinium_polyedra.AAC.1